MKIQRADIILIHSNKGIFGPLIHFIMKTFQKDPVKFQHVLLAKDETIAIESKWKISYSSIEEVLAKVDSYKVIRCKCFTEDDKDRIFALAQKLEGLEYSILRISLQLLDHLFYTNFFSNLYTDNKSHVCSSFIAWVFYVVKRMKFNCISWRSCDPDDIDDESIANPENWIIVAEK